jgi:hypothetical protein
MDWECKWRVWHMLFKTLTIINVNLYVIKVVI